MSRLDDALGRVVEHVEEFSYLAGTTKQDIWESEGLTSYDASDWYDRAEYDKYRESLWREYKRKENKLRRKALAAIDRLRKQVEK